jgi:HSP20 family protein
MLNTEQAIRDVGVLYQTLTGQPIQSARTELPPEVDAAKHVEARYRELLGMLELPSRPRAAPAPGQRVPWTPAMDVLEEGHVVRYEVDLPGVARDHVRVSLMGDVLVIQGERRERSAREALRMQERPAGPFQKIAALPPRARREGIEASFGDGVLSISVPLDAAGPEVAEVPVDVKRASA